MARQLVLWGPPTIPNEPGEPTSGLDVEKWIQRCVDVGVTKMISAGMKPMTIAAAHARGIEAHP